MSEGQYQTGMNVADLLKVNKAIVRRWIKDSELRAIDTRKVWRIGSDDLDSLLEGHATRPAIPLNGAADRPRADNNKEQQT